jgi:hypothetical protein
MQVYDVEDEKRVAETIGRRMVEVAIENEEDVSGMIILVQNAKSGAVSLISAMPKDRRDPVMEALYQAINEALKQSSSGGSVTLATGSFDVTAKVKDPGKSS